MEIGLLLPTRVLANERHRGCVIHRDDSASSRSDPSRRHQKRRTTESRTSCGIADMRSVCCRRGQAQQVVALDPFQHGLASGQHELTKKSAFERQHADFDSSDLAFDPVT
jgi:hypothetical protein